VVYILSRAKIPAFCLEELKYLNVAAPRQSFEPRFPEFESAGDVSHTLLRLCFYFIQIMLKCCHFSPMYYTLSLNIRVSCVIVGKEQPCLVKNHCL
jgi:hypothetical protein